MPDGHLYIFFGKMSIQVFCLFFVFCFLIRSVFLSISSISCLYTLDINPLSVIFANIFSHSVDCIFMLLMVFFAIQKFLHLIRSHLIPCLFFALETDPKKKCCYHLYQTVFCLCFLLGVLCVLVLYLSLLIHFEFIFVYGMKKCAHFLLLQVAVQFSQHRLLKRLCFLCCVFLPPLLWDNWP